MRRWRLRRLWKLRFRRGWGILRWWALKLFLYFYNGTSWFPSSLSLRKVSLADCEAPLLGDRGGAAALVGALLEFEAVLLLAGGAASAGVRCLLDSLRDN